MKTYRCSENSVRWLAGKRFIKDDIVILTEQNRICIRFVKTTLEFYFQIIDKHHLKFAT